LGKYGIADYQTVAISLYQIKIIINLKDTIMKNSIKFSLMLVLALITMNVHAANGDFSLNVKKGEGKIISFVLNDAINTNLTIYDANDKLIHTEELDSNGILNRTYDLNALPEGIYFLEADTKLKIVRYEISVVGMNASLASDALSTVYKPTFLYENGLVGLNILNFDNSPVAIRVYDEDNIELYTYSSTDKNVKKYFDIQNLPNKKYSFVMSYDNKTFENTVAKR